MLVKDGQIIGHGWHHRAGQPHAEIEAIRDAQAKGARVADATSTSPLSLVQRRAGHHLALKPFWPPASDESSLAPPIQTRVMPGEVLAFWRKKAFGCVTACWWRNAFVERGL